METVGTRATMVRRNSRRLDDFSDLFMTISNLSAVLMGCACNELLDFSCFPRRIRFAAKRPIKEQKRRHENDDADHEHREKRAERGRWRARRGGLSAKSLYNATYQACTASAKGGRMVCMVVTSGMNHQRATFQVCNFKPGRQYRIICITHSIHEQRGQITEMSITPGQAVEVTC